MTRTRGGISWGLTYCVWIRGFARLLRKYFGLAAIFRFIYAMSVVDLAVGEHTFFRYLCSGVG